jgi:hypothetical protein
MMQTVADDESGFQPFVAGVDRDPRALPEAGMNRTLGPEPGAATPLALMRNPTLQRDARTRSIALPQGGYALQPRVVRRRRATLGLRSHEDLFFNPDGVAPSSRAGATPLGFKWLLWDA